MTYPQSTATTAVIIPAFNEEDTISYVVSAAAMHATPIVVDDGSSDRTGQIAESANAIVIRHNQNKGYDLALQSGFNAAVRMGFEYAITLDADGQHDPHLLCSFKEALEQGADLVIGIRSKKQRISEKLFGWIGSALWGVPDLLCGMKGYNLRHMRIHGYFSTYDSIGTEHTIRGLKKGLNFKFVVVPVNTREDRSRFGEGWGPNYKILKALISGIVLAK